MGKAEGRQQRTHMTRHENCAPSLFTLSPHLIASEICFNQVYNSHTVLQSLMNIHVIYPQKQQTFSNSSVYN